MEIGSKYSQREPVEPFWRDQMAEVASDQGAGEIVRLWASMSLAGVWGESRVGVMNSTAIPKDFRHDDSRAVFVAHPGKMAYHFRHVLRAPE